MKVKTLVAALIFLIVLNVSVVGTIVYLHITEITPPIAKLMDGNPNFTPPFVQQFDEMENLTPQQRRELFQTIQTFRRNVQPLHDQVEAIEKEMLGLLMNDDSIPEEEVHRMMRQIADLRFEIGKYVVDNLQESKRFLSQEQQRIFIQRILSAGPRAGMNGPHVPRMEGVPNPKFDGSTRPDFHDN